eukprot:5181516-Amphidinium_carterae.1
MWSSARRPLHHPPRLHHPFSHSPRPASAKSSVPLHQHRPDCFHSCPPLSDPAAHGSCSPAPPGTVVSFRAARSPLLHCFVEEGGKEFELCGLRKLFPKAMTTFVVLRHGKTK